MAEGGITRRSVITGLAVAVAGSVAGYLVATNSALAHPSASATGPNGYGASPPTGGPKLLIAVDRVPSGGGVILPVDGVVVTRSSGGTVHGFSSICTHQGCTVGQVQGGEIICPCHGSRFDAQTGAVTNGPATRPLPAVPVEVRGGDVYTV